MVASFNLQGRTGQFPHVQEIAPILRVLGSYPMDLDQGSYAEDSASDDRVLSSNGALSSNDDLLMAVANATAREPNQAVGLQILSRQLTVSLISCL